MSKSKAEKRTKVVPMKKFKFKMDIDLWENEIWPDGDGPDSPDFDDVYAALRQYAQKADMNLFQVLNDWNMLFGDGFEVEEIITSEELNESNE